MSRNLVMSRADLRAAAEKAGPDSPLHAIVGRRKSGTGEEDAQIAAFATLVGPARKGQPRDPAGGMIPQHPDLCLLYAIPNGGYRTPKVAARMKAQGVLSTLPDMHLPVMRGPFLSLYVELKVRGRYGTPEQRIMAEALRTRGHCVIECQGTEEVVAVVLGYLALPPNRPSVRAASGPSFSGTLEERLRQWRERLMLILKPNRRPTAPAGAPSPGAP